MIRWIVLQRGGTLQERVPPCLRLISIVLPPSRREADTNGLAGCRLPASQSFIKGFDLYAYPAGTSFCSCASSRAALHVGSLFLRNRQPSNAPPLLLSPTGRATRWGPLMQNTLGDTPRPPRSSGATSASIGQTLRYTAGSPLRCGASSSPHKVLRPCGDPYLPARKAKGRLPEA